MAAIDFHYQVSSFKVPFPRKTSKWIHAAIKKERFKLIQLNFIFCSDEDLLRINVDFLKHNTYTDIITFDHSEQGGVVEGDIFISVDRVKENAHTLGIAEIDEIHRVMIHGVLHLVGYKDKNKEQKAQMRRKEDQYLSLR